MTLAEFREARQLTQATLSDTCAARWGEGQLATQLRVLGQSATVTAMSPLTPLERVALDAILAEETVWRPTLEQQLAGATALSRENTGGGFYTDLVIAPGIEASGRDFSVFGENVWISVEGMELGLGMILHARNGRLAFLEGYAVHPDSTTHIDFERVRFALTAEPQAFFTKD